VAETDIHRFAGSAAGRSRSVAFGTTHWTVANATQADADFDTQVAQTFAVLDASLKEAGTHRARLLSVQVILADMQDKARFDALWLQWIGGDPQGWPQRACYGAALAGGLRVELIVVAAREVVP
jgi:enamine deaminase RidA (YjgF/YER057c/UK114 family)